MKAFHTPRFPPNLLHMSPKTTTFAQNFNHMKDFHAYYQFEYSFITELMERYLHEDNRLSVLNDKLSWQGFLTRLFTDSGFDWTGLKIRTYGNEGDPLIVVLYIFPEPFRVPLARYGAILIHKGKLRYYTLESFTADTNNLCSQTTYGVHLNHGEYPALTPADFLREVCTISEITLPAPQSHRPKETLKEKLKKLL